jgi:hypothetical protein
MTEIVTCPSCDKKLQVPEEFFGKNVQCPECKQQFLAKPMTPAAPATATRSAAADVPAWEKPPGRELARLDDERPSKRRPRDDDDEEDRPRRRSRYGDDDDRPRRRRLAPHRGGMILAFGILAIVGVGSVVFGPMAWMMGNADLRAMREGYMDPSGEGQTNTGRVLGMISVILLVVGVLIGCLFFVFIMGMGILAGAAGPRR